MIVKGFRFFGETRKGAEMDKTIDSVGPGDSDKTGLFVYSYIPSFNKALKSSGLQHSPSTHLAMKTPEEPITQQPSFLEAREHYSCA